MHLIYAVLAIMLLGLFSLGMARGIGSSQTKMWQNEVLTQVTGVGLEVLEHVARQAFDENTDESKKPTPVTFPVITSAVMLTPEADFGGCAGLAYANPGCDDVDDFDGAQIDRTVRDVPYTIAVSVQYVDPGSPTTSTGGTKSLAKEILLTITTPLLQSGGQPVEMTMSRVVTYNRHLASP